MGLIGYYYARRMRVKLKIDPNKVDPNRLSIAIKKLEALGVYHNGEIVCEPEMDSQVMAIMDSLI